MDNSTVFYPNFDKAITFIFEEILSSNEDVSLDHKIRLVQLLIATPDSHISKRVASLLENCEAAIPPVLIPLLRKATWRETDTVHYRYQNFKSLLKAV